MRAVLLQLRSSIYSESTARYAGGSTSTRSSIYSEINRPLPQAVLLQLRTAIYAEINRPLPRSVLLRLRSSIYSEINRPLPQAVLTSTKAASYGVNSFRSSRSVSSRIC